MSLWRRANQDRIAVLTIHSVLDEDALDDFRPMRKYLELAKFRENLEFLQQRATFLSLSQALDILEGKAEPVANGIVLTFDDGYMNNFSLALPVLKALGIPATFFLVTSRVENRRPFWFDRIDFALQKNLSERFRIRVCGKTVNVEGTSPAQLRKAMLASFRILMSEGYNDRDLDDHVDEMLAPLEALQGQRLIDYYDEDSPCAIVTLPVLKQAIKSDLVTIGSHTHHHVRLTTMPDIDAIEELRRSAEWITSRTGTTPDFFCYPNGSYDRRTGGLIQAAGYRAALTCVEGLCSPGKQSAMFLPRINWSVDAGPVELQALTIGAYRDSLSFRSHEHVDESGPPVLKAGIASTNID
ncbi:MAG: polysaccharide deacetylase family protein [Pseudomonadales bacterium]